MSKDDKNQEDITLETEFVEPEQYVDPSELEQLYMSNGLSIIRRKQDKKVNYIRWRDVWDDNILFNPIVRSSSYPEKTYRAIAISIPQYEHISSSTTTYDDGFVLGLVFESNGTAIQQVFSGSNVKWK